MGLIEHEIEVLHVRATPVPGHEEMARWHLMARVSSLPDLPTHPNVREATEKILRKPIYREVLSTLESEDDFGLLNRGIRVNAHRVEHEKDSAVVRVWFDADEGRMHGVFDGGRTYAVIKKAQREARDIAHQWVDLYVYENAPPDLIQRMVETHNTAVQVQALSLADHRHEFQRLKEALYQADRLDEYVAWHEGDEGEIDAREVVALLIAVDSKRYPPRRLGGEHPVFTYSQKARALREYQQHRHHYERLAPIAPDVLRLRDHIQETAPRYWPRGHFASLRFVENRRCMLPCALPGRGEGEEPVLLPIDAKFPLEDYLRLTDAQERADPPAVEEASRGLEARIRQCAADIARKYLNPPRTTDFAILFLPTEGLFAEVLRRPGLAESIQRANRVVIAGPTTLWSILTSLQVGFRTLAIQKRSSEVWRLLAAVKAEWGRYGEILQRVQKKLHEASSTIEQAERRTRAIGRRLREVDRKSVV